ncbi:hypothetical protein SESBI_50162 [Sesbania bispinosa]|nr:hypothetical protein SESBI_50162 [Sesbania bispinosa]
MEDANVTNPTHAKQADRVGCCSMESLPSETPVGQPTRADEDEEQMQSWAKEEEVTKRVSMRKKKLPEKYSKKDSPNEKRGRSSKVRGGGIASGVGKRISPPLRRGGSKSTSSKPSRPLGASGKKLFKTPPTVGKPGDLENLTIPGTKLLGSTHTVNPVYVDFGRKLPKILKLMAMKITWRQRHVNVQTVWAFPPDFAVSEIALVTKQLS